MRPKGTAAALEARRLRAADLLAMGTSPAEVARLVGASYASVKQWQATLHSGGREALASKAMLPHSSQLTHDQKQQLVQLLLRGPSESGFESGAWTRQRVIAVIQQTFGISFAVAPLDRLLRELGFCPQTFEPLQRTRDEWTIVGLRRETEPAKKRRAVTALPWYCLMKLAVACSR